MLEEAKQRGLLVGRGGLYGNVLRIAPPLSLTRAEADEGAGVLIAAVEAAGRGDHRGWSSAPGES